ncbi:MAG: hypothetical protein FK734_17030 [Asgard group archaeon]|nr:hypothetical protein [Asgard group archaeon]
MKYKISSLTNQWLISTKTQNGYESIGSIKPMPTDAILFTLSDSKLLLKKRTIENRILFTIELENYKYQATISKDETPSTIIWKSQANTKNQLKIITIQSYNYLQFDKNRIARTKTINETNYFLEILIDNPFPPIFILACLAVFSFF